MNRDDIADGLDEAATWDECAPYPSSSRAALESRDADARRESAATYPGGRGTGANLAADEPPAPEWAKAMFDVQAGMILEQAERIDEQADIIANLDAQIGLLHKGYEQTVEGFATHQAALRLAKELIDSQGDIIDQLHVANKHLAGRFDKVSGIADRNAVSTSKFLGNFQTRINRLEAWRARAIEAAPQLGKQATEEDNRG